jgi:hypothetical protein
VKGPCLYRQGLFFALFGGRELAAGVHVVIYGHLPGRVAGISASILLPGRSGPGTAFALILWDEEIREG